MIDKLIEFKKEWGWLGVFGSAVIIVYSVYFYGSELIKFIEKMSIQGLTNRPVYGIMKAQRTGTGANRLGLRATESCHNSTKGKL